MKFKFNSSIFLLVAVLSLNMFVGCGKNTMVDETDDVSDTEVEAVSDTESADVEKDNTKGKKKINSGDIIFSTEYQIEDSRRGTFIVSKSDGLLYGLLDNQGNEVIPVEYDKLEYIGDDKKNICYVNNFHINENFIETNNDKYIGDEYILAKYENQYTIFDLNGKEILNTTTDKDVEYIDNEIKNTNPDGAVFAISDKEGTVTFYKSDGTVFKEVKLDNGNYTSKPLYGVRWINSACFVGLDNSGSSVTQSLYNYDFDVLSKLSKYSFSVYTSGDNVVIFSPNDTGSTTKYVIDITGNIIEASEALDGDEISYNEEKEKNMEHKLYKSNDTWKLDDSNENAIYDERYYNKYDIEGSNNCFALENEDKQICLFNRNAKLMVDYGILEMKDDRLYINGKRAVDEPLYEDKDCIYILAKDSEMTNVYYFDGE